MPKVPALRKLNYYWRVLATGLSFAIFCVGGIVLAAMSVYVLITHKNRADRSLFMRKWLSRIFRVYLRLLRKLGLITFEIQHKERIKPRGQLVIANHPSLLDVCFIISLIEESDCIVKEALFHWPLTAAPVRAANYIANEFNGLIERCLASLQTGASLIIFPEGTRSPPGQLHPFHRGASNIALMSGKNITPIVISCHPQTLLKHQRWYEIASSPPHYVIRVMPDIELSQIIDATQLQSRSARVLNAYLMDYFAKAINNPQLP
ncbi:MAG: 1-acyl-sn-glycerol-3-phosphate acyltransferase [Moraxellaceae bacterium]|nr:MAG: 1-acyl-sn-glycerol-3-phosphate acyltransferase [Moraxellaceae bacterium]